MVGVNKIYDFCNFVTNKEQAGNTINALEFNTLLYAVNLNFFCQRYGLPQQYTPGQPLPKISYEITQKITDDLSKFKVRMGIDCEAMIVDVNGHANIPSDYLHFSSARYNQITNNSCGNSKVKVRTIEHLTDAQLGDRLTDSIKMPTTKHPVFTTFKNYFQFYPKTLRYVEFTYLRLPITPIYNYTTDETTDLEVFTETGSVHFEYPEDCFSDLVGLCLSYIGVNLRAVDIVQYAEMLKEKGI